MQLCGVALSLALILLAGPCRLCAETTTNTPPAAASTNQTDVTRATDCLEYIAELVTHVSALEDAARATNQLAHADFIHARVLKLSGLHEVVTGLRDQFRRVQRGDAETDEIETARAKLDLARTRATQLAREADDSPAEDVVKPRKRRASVSLDATTSPGVPTPRPKPRRRPDTDDNCLRQSGLALLLAQAIELSSEVNLTAEKSVAELTKLAIEPLGGWHSDKCCTLDDLSVAVARALGLRIENPSDPASYTQALRDFGLPVDTLMPVRSTAGAAPNLTEPPVREFFLNGLAAPPASAKPHLPD